MPNDDFTLDQFQRIAMTLSEILANRPQNRALARASDVPGADLQWMYTAAYPTGAWYGDLGELGTTAFRDALFTGYLALGVTCKVSGVPYSWGASGWSLTSCGPIYNGTTLPLPVGGDNCTRIRVANPAVPRGWSWLEWTGSIWAPPSGEVIASEYSPTSLIEITATGFNTGEFTNVYTASQVMPEYMFPIGTSVICQFSGGLADISNPASGAIQAGLTSQATPSGDSNDCMAGIFIATMESFHQGPGFGARVSTRRDDTTLTVDNLNSQNMRGVFWPSGPKKFRVAIKPGAVTNNFSMVSYKVTAQ